MQAELQILSGASGRGSQGLFQDSLSLCRSCFVGDLSVAGGCGDTEALC